MKGLSLFDIFDKIEDFFCILHDTIGDGEAERLIVFVQCVDQALLLEEVQVPKYDSMAYTLAIDGCQHIDVVAMFGGGAQERDFGPISFGLLDEFHECLNSCEAVRINFQKKVPFSYEIWAGECDGSDRAGEAGALIRLCLVVPSLEDFPVLCVECVRQYFP